MRARYTCAVRYTVSAVCVTPLRTSGQSGDSETVLRTHNGCAFLQGTSLAGALRGWLSSMNPALEEPLFGSQTATGRLMVSDACFDDSARMELRPRLRLNGETGSADDGGKYDVAHIAVGSVMTFTLHYLGDTPDSAETKAIEQMFTALHNGEIRLGAQKSNGFGQVKLTVYRRVFHMADAGERRDWLSDSGDIGQALTLSGAIPRSGILFTVSGQTDSLLVRASASRQTAEGSVIENLMENGGAILPGSSIRGAVRNRVQMIAQFLRLSKDTTDRMFGRDADVNDNGCVGRIQFSDVGLEPAAKPITRIRVDRFTGGVMRGGLFREAPVSGNVTLRISAPADDTVACALLSYALRDLGLGLYHLGSGQAIGRGIIRVQEITVAAPEGQRITMRFQDGTCTVAEGQALLTRWLSALDSAREEAS